MCDSILRSYVRSSNYLVSVWNQLWALNMTWRWPCAIRSSNTGSCMKLLTDMPWSTCNRLVQKKMFCCFPTETPGLWLTFLKACGRWGHVYRHQRQSYEQFLNKKPGYVTLFHCSWRPAWYQICGIRGDITCGIHGGTFFWTISSNQLVCTIRRGSTTREERLEAGTVVSAMWLRVWARYGSERGRENMGRTYE